MFGYLYAEVTRGYMLEHDEAKFKEKRKRVYTFAKIPKELEKVSTFKFFRILGFRVNFYVEKSIIPPFYSSIRRSEYLKDQYECIQIHQG